MARLWIVVPYVLYALSSVLAVAGLCLADDFSIRMLLASVPAMGAAIFLTLSQWQLEWAEARDHQERLRLEGEANQRKALGLGAH